MRRAVVLAAPDSEGVIHACYKTDGGQLRVVDGEKLCSEGRGPVPRR
jgi:hypothetical protein